MNLLLILFLTFFLFSQNANALSSNVMFNCSVDYFQHCSQYPVNGDEVRECFKKVGKKLKPYCIDALKKEGLVTEEDKEEVIKKEEPVPVIEVPKEEPKTEERTVISIDQNDQVEVKRTYISDIKNSIKNRIKKIQTKVKEFKPSVKEDKWKGYPKYLSWKTDRRYLGGELTLYGLEDRK